MPVAKKQIVWHIFVCGTNNKIKTDKVEHYAAYHPNNHCSLIALTRCGQLQLCKKLNHYVVTVTNSYLHHAHTRRRRQRSRWIDESFAGRVDGIEKVHACRYHTEFEPVASSPETEAYPEGGEREEDKFTEEEVSAPPDR